MAARPAWKAMCCVSIALTQRDIYVHITHTQPEHKDVYIPRPPTGTADRYMLAYRPQGEKDFMPHSHFHSKQTRLFTSKAPNVSTTPEKASEVYQIWGVKLRMCPLLNLHYQWGWGRHFALVWAKNSSNPCPFILAPVSVYGIEERSLEDRH